MDINGKKFAAEFDRIDAVKGNDKFLVEDSKDGKCKYATPSQINAQFNQLVADINVAVEAASQATSANASAQTAKDAAAKSAQAAVASQTAAAQSAQDAKNSQTASAEMYSAINRVSAEHIVKIHNDIAALFELLLNPGDQKVHSLDSALMPMVCGCPLILSRDGVPSADTIPEQKGIPAFVGQKYLDVTNHREYTAYGVSSVGDWR